MEIRQGHCIYCGGGDVKYVGHEISDGCLGAAVHYDVYCPECDRHFVEVHDMIYGGAIDDQGNDVESDYDDDEEF